MKLAVAVGGIFHETNTFCTEPTPLSAFRRWRGTQLLDHFTGTRTYVGGMIASAADIGATVKPLVFAETEPSGVIEAAAYESLRGELIHALERSRPFDAVALVLHGAAVSDSIQNLEADLCRTVRALVGRELPIVATFDLHANNITQELANDLDLLLGVHFYPHTDMFERGMEAIAFLPSLLSHRLVPVTHVEYLPMLVPASTTLFGSAAESNQRCLEIERRSGVIDCTFFHGFIQTDTPNVGARIVVAASKAALAERAAREVASWVWQHRETFRQEALTPQDAVAQALSTEGLPIVIADFSDNPGGGAPGDGTHLLRAMLDAGLEDAAFGFVYDPEVAAAAHEVGVGEVIDVTLGGKHDDLHGPPLDISGYVKCLSDGRFVLRTPMAAGLQQDLGRMARLRVGGVDLLVSSRRQQTFDPEVFLLHGIDIRRVKVVGLKSEHHFRAGFSDIAAKILTAESPGLTTSRVELLPYTRLRRPIWPLDSAAAYPPEEVAVD